MKGELRLICETCGSPYLRAKGQAYGRSFCSRDCYYGSRRVPLELVYLNDAATCHLCGEHVFPDEASRDHLRPRSQGGKTVRENIRLAHRRCNSDRRSQPVEAYRAALRKSA